MRTMAKNHNYLWLSWLKAECKKAGLTICSFAEKAGISRTKIYRWNVGEAVPTDLEIHGLMHLLNVTDYTFEEMKDMILRGR